MQESTRMRVAAVVGTIVRRKTPVLQEHSIGGCANLGAGDSDASLREWANRSVHFPNGSAGHFDFWDPDTSAHVQMMLTEDTLWGFDFHTNCHFSGTILKQTLSIYDYETGRRYDYYL